MDEVTSAFPIVNERYQILNTISSGGMAVIYRAKDMVLDREIAIKLLKLELARKDIFRDQFSTEAKASASLSHPNIVTTFDFGLYGDRLYIAMELIDGFLLKDIIPDTGISFKQRFDYIKQACLGLAYAHQRRIVHCDIKPQNMLISHKGILKLTDFGISHALDTISRENKTGEVWGSPYYIAPEITRGLPPSPAADVYSMGIVMYETFTKKLPFMDDDVLTLVEKHLEGQATPARTINPQIPENLNAVIVRAMEKNPTDRFTDGGELLQALLSIDADLAPDEAVRIDDVENDQPDIEIIDTVNPPEKQINWTTILLGFLAVIAVGGLIPFWLFIYYSINR